MTKQHIIAASSFQPVLGVVMYYEGSDCSILVMLPDFIQNANISFEENDEDSFGRELIKATANVGKYRIDMWFDPALNFALRRVRKETSQITGGAQLVWSETRVTSHEKVLGLYLPKEYYTEENFSAGKIEVRKGDIVDTPASQDKTEYILTNFLTDNRKDDFKIVGIPDGTHVFAEDVPQIRYIWAEGKIQPATDELMLRIARGGHKFMPGTEEPRFWLMAIGIILILIGGGRLAYKHFIKKDDVL